MVQLRASGSWCSKCPLKEKKLKEGRDGDLAGCWISNRSCLLLGQAFESSLGWSSHQLLPLQGHWALRDQGQVSPAFHMALIKAMSLWRSQERAVINKPALKGECVETDQSGPCYACLGQGDTFSSTWKDFCSFSLCFGPQIPYVMRSWGTKPTTKINPNPTPSLLYYLFFHCCPKPVYYRKSWHIPQRHCGLNPWIPTAPASHRPVLTVYSLLSGGFQVSMALFFCQRKAV